MKWADKNRAFWKFRVNFGGQKLIRFLWKWFSLKNIKLEDQLSLTTFLILFIFIKLYLVNLCPIFVGSFQNLSESWEENNYLGLISVQNFTFVEWAIFFYNPSQTLLNSMFSLVHTRFDFFTLWNLVNLFDCSNIILERGELTFSHFETYLICLTVPYHS